MYWSLFSVMALVAMTFPRTTQIPDREIRPAAVKSVELLQTAAQTWFSKQSCVSCHHQDLPMMVFGLALQHGVDVDRSALQMIMNKSFGYLTDLDRAVQGSHVIDPVQSLAHAMVPAASLGLGGTASTGAYARLIARRQLADGHWLVFDDRPPQAFSPFSATAYAVRALQLFLPDSMMQERQERIERARSWLRTNRPFDTEDRTFQLFGLQWTGAEPE